jgi:hypothetical protein
MTDEDTRDNRWTVFRCGMVGVYVLGVVCGIRFLWAIPRLFTEDWTWSELLWFPFQVIVLGFVTGGAHGILLPLARFGRIGDAIIGAGCCNVYLLVCFVLFETKALLNPRLDTALALSAIATFAGAAFGLIVGHEIRSSAKADKDPE